MKANIQQILISTINIVFIFIFQYMYNLYFPLVLVFRKTYIFGCLFGLARVIWSSRELFALLGMCMSMVLFTHMIRPSFDTFCSNHLNGLKTFKMGNNKNKRVIFVDGCCEGKVSQGQCTSTLRSRTLCFYV